MRNLRRKVSGLNRLTLCLLTLIAIYACGDTGGTNDDGAGGSAENSSPNSEAGSGGSATEENSGGSDGSSNVGGSGGSGGSATEENSGGSGGSTSVIDDCIVGSMRTCDDCPEGEGSGHQVCTNDGTYSDCLCPSASGGSGGDGNVTPPSDECPYIGYPRDCEGTYPSGNPCPGEETCERDQTTLALVYSACTCLITENTGGSGGSEGSGGFGGSVSTGGSGGSSNPGGSGGSINTGGSGGLGGNGGSVVVPPANLCPFVGQTETCQATDVDGNTCNGEAVCVRDENTGGLVYAPCVCFPVENLGGSGGSEVTPPANECQFITQTATCQITDPSGNPCDGIALCVRDIESGALVYTPCECIPEATGGSGGSTVAPPENECPFVGQTETCQTTDELGVPCNGTAVCTLDQNTGALVYAPCTCDPEEVVEVVPPPNQCPFEGQATLCVATNAAGNQCNGVAVCYTNTQGTLVYGACLCEPSIPLCEDLPDPVVDFTPENVMTMEELENIPPGTPAYVLTVMRGVTPVYLRAVYSNTTHSPLTSSMTDRYLWLETADGVNAECTDPRWDRSYGPAHGMSGSPVIINNKIAGTLSYSVGIARDAPYPFIATPMIGVIATGSDLSSCDVQAPLPMDDAQALNALFVAGGSPNANFLERRNGNPIDVRYIADSRNLPNGLTAGSPGAGAGNENYQFSPGAMMTGAIVTGDVDNFAVYGTLSFVDGNDFWAFGHPFDWNGCNGHMPILGSSVIDVLGDNIFGGYKVPEVILGTTYGTLLWDGSKGIYGRTDVVPDTIPVETEVRQNGVTEETYNHTVTRGTPYGDEQVIALVGSDPILTSMDASIPGSAEYRVEIEFNNSTTLATRSNLYNSRSSLYNDLFWEFYSELNEFGYYEFDHSFRSVAYVIDWSSQQREVELTYVDVPNDPYLGSNVDVSVDYLDVESGAARNITVPIHIPINFRKGWAQLEAYNPQEPDDDWRYDNGELYPAYPTNLEEAITRFNEKPRNNTLRVRITSRNYNEFPSGRTVFVDVDMEGALSNNWSFYNYVYVNE